MQTIARIGFLLIAAAALNLGTPSARAGMQPAVEITTRIPSDLRLPESFWNEGTWQTGFTRLTTKGEAAHQTRFRILADKERLYLAFRVQGGDECRQAKVTERDGPVWEDDTVEFFVGPALDPTRYSHFIVNRLGTVFDQAINQGGISKYVGWNADARTFTQTVKNGWRGILAVPFSDLQLPSNESEIKVQVARNCHHHAELACWPPSAGAGFGVASDFAGFTLSHPDLAIFSWDLRLKESAVVKSGGQLKAVVKLSLANLTKKFRVVTLKMKGAQGKVETVLSIDRDQIQSIELALPMEHDGKTVDPVSFEVAASGKSGETVLWRSTLPMNLKYEGYHLTLLNPGYRSAIFESQEDKSIEGVLRLLDPELKIGEVKAILTSATGSDRPPVEGAATEAESGRWKITVPDIGHLPAGTYRLRVSGRCNDEPFVVEREIAKLPSQEGEMWIDKNGVVRRNGKPFAAFGFCFGLSEFLPNETIPGIAMNTLVPIWAVPPFETTRATLQILEKNQLRGIVYIWTAVGSGQMAETKEAPLTEQERKELRDLAAAMRGNPNVLGYYQVDEPDARGYPLSRMKEAYEILKEEDPHKPVYLLNDSINGMKIYGVAADIMMPDAYPTYLAGKGSGKSQATIGQFLEQVPIGAEPFKARWLTPQAFSYSAYHLEGHRAPTAREMRAQMVLGILHGATGITWYPSYMVWDEPGVAASLKYLSDEFSALSEYFTVARPRLIASTGDAAVEAAISSLGERKILWIANTEFAPVTARIQDEEAATVKEWRVVGTGEVVKGGLEVKLKPHEAMVLASPEVPLSDALDWLRVEAEEKRMQDESFDPRNVAHLKSGATAVGFGYRERCYPSLAMMIDGFKDMRARGFVAGNEVPEGAGVEIKLASARHLRKIRLTGAALPEADLQVVSKGIAKVIASIPETKLSPTPLEFTFDEGKADSIRLVLRKPGKLKLIEIEAYE